MIVRIAIVLLVLLSLATAVVAQKGKVEIQLIHNDEREKTTKAQLLKLLSTYDLDRWIFTDKVVIESGIRVVPHSHPVLTLSTRHIKDEDLLLATFIHEQLHWFVSSHPAKDSIYKSLKAQYPDPVTTFPDGSGDEISTYYHILICHLEHKALKEILGELRAFQILSFWQKDHYRWIYRAVIEDEQKLDSLVKKYAISP